MLSNLQDEKLPFVWKSGSQGKSDQLWLKRIIESSPPLSDRWTKAKIVQLAHDPSLHSEYAKEDIVNKLRLECSKSYNLDDYPCFKEEVNAEYVTDTLKQWKAKKFRQAIARNFDIYAYRGHDNVFLVTSRTRSSFDIKQDLPPEDKFRSLFNIKELAKLVKQAKAKRLTVRTHGYGTPGKSFYQNFPQEAELLKNIIENPQHFYIGYSWPSEAPLPFLGKLQQLLANPLTFFGKGYKQEEKKIDIRLKFFLVLAFSAVLFGVLVLLLSLLTVFQQWRWYWIFTIIFLLWGMAFWLLREVSYQGDRTRAIYYGIPDLAEFFSRLDDNLSKNDEPIQVDLIGHSMGGLVVLNTLQTLCYQYRNNGDSNQFGNRFRMDKLILVSPDVPLELLREGRNNYARTAMQCCQQIYLMSSDRDLVLRYLSTVGNWFTEPNIQMSGMRLGNIYLQQVKVKEKLEYRPWIRTMFSSQPTVLSDSSYELLHKINYLDCSQMGGVNSIPWKLSHWKIFGIEFNLNGILIDMGNFIPTIWDCIMSFFIKQEKSGNKLDVHGGYFQKDRTSFEIFKMLLSHDDNDADREQNIKEQIEKIIADEGHPIKFLSSHEWEMPKP